MHLMNERGAIGLLSTPAPYLLVALGIIATLLQQSAFHAGALQTSVPAMLVLEPIVAVCLGAVLLGEELDVDGYRLIALALAVGAMTAATFSLGRGEGAYAAELEIEAARAA
jgi:EamA domain-containing membrane protein RarD